MSLLTLPAPRCDFLDQRTGKVSREWVLFFQQSFERMGGADAATISAISELIREILASIADKEVELAFADVSTGAIASAEDVSSKISSNDAQIYELKKDIEELRQQIATITDCSALLAETRKSYASSTAKLSYFAATTSAELAGVISDETGSGSLVFASSPTLVTPDIGVATGTSLTTTGVLASTFSSPSSATVAIKLFDATGNYGIGMANTVAEGFVNYSSGTANTTIFGHRWLVNGVERAKVDGSGLFTIAGAIKCLGGATFLTTSSALTNGAGISGGTLTNAPAAGNPTKWIGINDNGTTRYIPSW